MPATDLNKPPKGFATGASAFTAWADVRHCTAPNTWSYAKKVFAHNGSGWVEVWNNRPVTTTAAGTSSAFDRITANGAVDPNNLSATPRFYYKKNADSTYTAGAELTALTGDTSQNVTSTITGLTENTTYNYYLLASNSAGTSDTPTVRNVTTPINCDQAAAGWSSSAAPAVTVGCGTCGSRTTVTTTYTKTGCTTYTAITSDTGCVEDACGCKAASTNGWSALQTRYRTVGCGGYCNGQDQYQQYITKSGCTEYIVTDWTNTGSCTDRFSLQDASGFETGWNQWMERLGYGSADNRWIQVYNVPFNPYIKFFGDYTYCYGCGSGCQGTSYRIVRCPLTGTYYWTDVKCDGNPYYS